MLLPKSYEQSTLLEVPGVPAKASMFQIAGQQIRWSVDNFHFFPRRTNSVVMARVVPNPTETHQPAGESVPSNRRRGYPLRVSRCEAFLFPDQVQVQRLQVLLLI